MRARTAIAGAVLTLLVLLAGPPAPASADFTQIETVSAFSPHDSAAKSVTVNCPAGKRVVGAGAYASPGLQPHAEHVLVDAVRPGAQLTSVTARAREDETGTAQSWLLQAYARCAPPPAGLERIATTSVSSSANKSAIAVCPSGKRLLGTGAETTGVAGQVLLDGMLPDAGLTRTTANAVEDPTGTTQTWTVTAYAICANPVRGLQRVRATAPPDSGASKVVGATCPAGKILAGTGGTIERSIGPASLYVLEPGERGMSMGAFVNSNQRTTSWALTAYAICAAGAHRVTVTSPLELVASWRQAAPCPAGMESSGVGGEVGFAQEDAWLEALRPRDGIDAGEAYAALVASRDSPWRMTAHAVCRTRAAGTTLVTAAGELDSAANKSATATCPSGLRVVGAGGEAASAAEDEELAQLVFVQALRPDAALRSVTLTAQRRDYFRDFPWQPRVWAICAPAPAGLERIASTSPSFADESAYASAQCPAGKHLIGLGGEIHGGGPYKGFDDLAPDPGLTRVSVLATEDGRRQGTPWSVTAYAICVNR